MDLDGVLEIAVTDGILRIRGATVVPLPLWDEDSPHIFGFPCPERKKALDCMAVGDKGDIAFRYNKNHAQVRAAIEGMANLFWDRMGLPHDYLTTASWQGRCTTALRDEPCTAASEHFGLKSDGLTFLNLKGGKQQMLLPHAYHSKTYLDLISKRQRGETTDAPPAVEVTRQAALPAEKASYYGDKTVLPRLAAKRGHGTKFFREGANACINVILLKQADTGALEVACIQRPPDGSDPSECQATGCIFFTVRSYMLGRDGSDELVTESYTDEEQRRIHADELPVKNGVQATPSCLVHGNVGPRGEALALLRYACQRAVLEKICGGKDIEKMVRGEDDKPRYPSKRACSEDDEERRQLQDIVMTWNFWLLEPGGVVDDPSNTKDAWVESAYAVHVIEGDDELENKLFEKLRPPERLNVGLACWKSIDSTVATHTSQFVKIPAVGEHYQVLRAPVEQPFDWMQEFENWHGPHSLMMKLAELWFRAHYHTVGKAAYGFSQVAPQDVKSWITMRADDAELAPKKSRKSALRV